MARNVKISGAGKSADKGAVASKIGADASAVESIAAARDWINGSLAAAQQAANWMDQFQRLSVQAASSITESLAASLNEVEQAKDPVQLVSVQSSLVNRQLEELAQQLAAAMQQLFDTQLLWFGQMDEKTPTPAVGKSNPAWDTTALSLWGKAHDDWLAMTQRWIASADPAATRH